MRSWRASLLAQSLFYVAAGINHFWHAASYRHIMPDHYAHPDGLVELSGLAEILGGLGLLLPATRRASAAGIVLMLVIFLDVHQFMLRHPERFPEVPVWALWARLPLQFALMAWAWKYTRLSDGSPALPPGTTIQTRQDVQ
jgi:uncharacterized membrane protein